MTTTEAKESLAESAYRRIKADILGSRLLPGETVAAYQLAPELGMSRTPVHDALKALCQEGFLKVVPRVGYLVTTLSMADIQEIFQLRLTLESLAAAIAADRYTRADRRQFEEYHRNIEALLKVPVEDTGRPSRMIMANKQFHMTVARLSGNTRLANLIEALIDECQRIHMLPFVADNDWGDPHEDVVAALEAGDGEAARQAMAKHVRDSQRFTLAAMSELKF